MAVLARWCFPQGAIETTDTSVLQPCRWQVDRQRGNLHKNENYVIIYIIYPHVVLDVYVFLS